MITIRKFICLVIFLAFAVSTASAGLSIVRSSGITLTGADGITLTGADGITLTGADGFLSYQSNGITLTGADGLPITNSNGITLTGADGASYVGPNGITLTGADGITLTGADGITLTGADGITLTGADGTQYRADSIVARQPNGITLTGADGANMVGVDGITLTGADGTTQTGPNVYAIPKANGITLTGADGITSTSVNGITLTGADSITGFNTSGVVFDLAKPTGITLTGADGITLTGADGISITNPTGITLTGVDGIMSAATDGQTGLQSVDPELAITLNNATDDSSINAVVVFHGPVSDANISQLQQIGIFGGTRFRVLPMVYVSATKSQIIAVSHLASVRSIYGNRTLNFNSDPYFNPTGVQRVGGDGDLRTANGGLPVTGRNVTVAVLDTGINALHPDLAGRVVQNVRLVDSQSAPAGFVNPVPVENLSNTDAAAGHGTFVAGVIAGSGASSAGKYNGVATGAKLLGLSAGDVDLTNVLSGFDYLLDKGQGYNVRVVNCSFSANTVFDYNDPVNVATKMLTDAGVNVVFSAGNSGPGNGTLNPYSAAPWVVGVGATDINGKLASFSSRGNLGDQLQHPSLVAPGVNIVSLRSTVTTTSVSGIAGADAQRLSATELPYYTTASGTSFSAPQVAGAIALMLEANTNLTPAGVKGILSRTATPMPKYFYHEAGAGMLNTYAAVLQAEFPDRRIGAFRSALASNSVRFVTTTAQNFTQTVYPGLASSVNVPIPANTVQGSVSISWGFSSNDFGLKVFDPSNNLAGESNYLNLPGLTGRREKVVLRNPVAGTFRAATQHTANLGTVQNVLGMVELTQVQYPNLLDLGSLSPDLAAQAQLSLLSNVMLPEGMKFRPDSVVSRADLAVALVRSGSVPQYMAAAPLFTDVRDNATRCSVESVQSNPSGKLIFDATPGGRFYPNNNATKLIAAVAMVKAAGLDAQAASTPLSLAIADAYTIPTEFRGYVAVALQNGFISLDGNLFNPTRGLTRLELARGMNAIVNR